jgi:hypothetical protein
MQIDRLLSIDFVLMKSYLRRMMAKLAFSIVLGIFAVRRVSLSIK